MTSFDVPTAPDPEDPDLAGDESVVPVPEVVLSERDRMPRWIPRAILLFLVGVLSLSVFTWLVSRLRSLLLMILVSLFLSFAMEPAVNRLSRRGWRRGVATGAVFLGVVLLFAGFLFAMGSVLADQIQRLIDQAPTYIEDIQSWAESQFNVQIDAQGLIA
ncbi:MAG TPA: AI-2E family transporter, partial [Acidimicrobiales bacterium]|nr:AI-2E family transporter [Acidimicrobiales bacterium]